MSKKHIQIAADIGVISASKSALNEILYSKNKRISFGKFVEYCILMKISEGDSTVEESENRQYKSSCTIDFDAYIQMHKFCFENKLLMKSFIQSAIEQYHADVIESIKLGAENEQ